MAEQGMRVQTRGPVRDILGAGPGGLALCECVHGKTWPEGDRFEPEGAACQECSVASLKAFHASLEAT